MATTIFKKWVDLSLRDKLRVLQAPEKAECVNAFTGSDSWLCRFPNSRRIPAISPA